MFDRNDTIGGHRVQQKDGVIVLTEIISQKVRLPITVANGY